MSGIQKFFITKQLSLPTRNQNEPRQKQKPLRTQGGKFLLAHPLSKTFFLICCAPIITPHKTVKTWAFDHIYRFNRVLMRALD